MTERVKLLLIIWALSVATVWIVGPFVAETLLTADEPRIVLPRGKLAEFERVSTELFESASPTVVYIFTETASTGVPVPRGGAGSGFVWDGAGHVVTNFHVVQGAERIAVRLDSAPLRVKAQAAAPLRTDFLGRADDHQPAREAPVGP